MKKLLRGGLWYCLLLCVASVHCMPTLLAVTKTANKAPIKKPVTKQVAKPAPQTMPTTPAQTINIHFHTDGNSTVPATTTGTTLPVSPAPTPASSSSSGDSSDKKDAEIAGGTLGAIGTAVGTIAATVYAKHKDISKANAAEQKDIDAEGKIRQGWADRAKPAKLLEKATELVENQEIAIEQGEKPNLSEARFLEIIDKELQLPKRATMEISIDDIRVQVQDKLEKQRLLEDQITEKGKLLTQEESMRDNQRSGAVADNSAENNDNSEEVVKEYIPEEPLVFK